MTARAPLSPLRAHPARTRARRTMRRPPRCRHMLLLLLLTAAAVMARAHCAPLRCTTWCRHSRPASPRPLLAPVRTSARRQRAGGIPWVMFSVARFHDEHCGGATSRALPRRTRPAPRSRTTAALRLRPLNLRGGGVAAAARAWCVRHAPLRFLVRRVAASLRRTPADDARSARVPPCAATARCDGRCPSCALPCEQADTRSGTGDGQDIL